MNVITEIVIDGEADAVFLHLAASFLKSFEPNVNIRMQPDKILSSISGELDSLLLESFLDTDFRPQPYSGIKGLKTEVIRVNIKVYPGLEPNIQSEGSKTYTIELFKSNPIMLHATKDPDVLRLWSDEIKNEMFKFYRDYLRKKKS